MWHLYNCKSSEPCIYGKNYPEVWRPNYSITSPRYSDLFEKDKDFVFIICKIVSQSSQEFHTDFRAVSNVSILIQENNLSII